MSALKDISGKVFGRLKVIEKTNERLNSGAIKWLCLCDCGAMKSISGVSLRNGDSKSCGCLFIDTAKNKGLAKKAHGMTESAEYHTWIGMKQRCLNKNNSKYVSYGSRGISVCDEWVNSFPTFYADMGDRPDGTTLDRIDPNGNYCFDNCRWATQKQQQNNRTNNKKIELFGVTYTLALACEKFKKNQDKVQQRLKRGWSTEKAFDFDL